MTRTGRIIMMKREAPKRVTLPVGRTFIARQRHVTRADVPANIHIRCPYRQRAAPQGRHQQIAIQQGRGLRSNILKFTEKVIKAPVVQELGEIALN